MGTLRSVLVGFGFTALGALTTALALKLADGTTNVAVADTTTSKKPPKEQKVGRAKSNEWELKPTCTMSSHGTGRGNGSIMVNLLFKGGDTVVSCPERADDCTPGEFSDSSFHLFVACQPSGDGDGRINCEGHLLRLKDIEQRKLSMFTVSVLKPQVKSASLADGEFTIGPIYGGVDLVVTGMTTSKDFAYGGNANIVGMGGMIIKSKIEYAADCDK